MANMSEKDWAAFAASKDLDPTTGSKAKPIESIGINDYDINLILGQFAGVRAAIEKTQIFMVIGFAALAILHFIR